MSFTGLYPSTWAKRLRAGRGERRRRGLRRRWGLVRRRGIGRRYSDPLLRHGPGAGQFTADDLAALRVYGNMVLRAVVGGAVALRRSVLARERRASAGQRDGRVLEHDHPGVAVRDGPWAVSVPGPGERDRRGLYGINRFRRVSPFEKRIIFCPHSGGLSPASSRNRRNAGVLCELMTPAQARRMLFRAVGVDFRGASFPL